MKTLRHLFYVLAFSISTSTFCSVTAQTNTFPTTGNVGIGTTSPATLLDVKAGLDQYQTSTQYVAPYLIGGTNDYGAGGAAQFILLIPIYGGTVGEAAAGMIGKLTMVRGGTGASNSVFEYDVSAQTAYNISYINLFPKSNQSYPLNVYSVTYAGTPYLAVKGSDLVTSGGLCTYTGHFWNSINSAKPQLVLASSCSSITLFQTITYLGGSALTVNSEGYVGIGTNSPFAALHVSGNGVSIDTNTNSFSGILSIQANTGGRSTTYGAELEFVIPSSTTGSSPWGQGRIITVAGNTNSGDATGKMILGTRRYFNKVGNGNNWYYGNDITIDGSGNVGIGTLYPQSLFSVEGNITAKQMTVLQTGWSDFVFDSCYRTMPLDNVSQYIKEHKHLPEIPSTGELAQSGLDIGAMQKLHMQKIEELTLYAIEANTRLNKQDSTIIEQKEQLQKQEQRLQRFEDKLNAQRQEIEKLKQNTR